MLVDDSEYFLEPQIVSLGSESKKVLKALKGEGLPCCYCINDPSVMSGSAEKVRSFFSEEDMIILVANLSMPEENLRYRELLNFISDSGGLVFILNMVLREQTREEMLSQVSSLNPLQLKNILYVPVVCQEDAEKLQEDFSEKVSCIRAAIEASCKIFEDHRIPSVDFTDFRTVAYQGGMARCCYSQVSASDPIERLVQLTLLPLESSLPGVKGFFVTLYAGPDVALSDFQVLSKAVEGYASDNCVLLASIVIDESYTGTFGLSILAVMD